MPSTPSNVTVEEVRKFELRIFIGDVLDERAIGPSDEVTVVLMSNSTNRNMVPLRLSYSALMRLTSDA